MAKSLCIIHANCQGDGLKQLLAHTPQFSQKFEIVKYTNFLKEKIPLAQLKTCKLFLYQHIGDHWGESASHRLLQNIPHDAIRISIPNMFFNGYWPLHTSETFMAFGDMLLEHLASKGLSCAEVNHLYLRTKLSKLYDFDALYKVSRDKEEVKEQYQDIKSLHIIDNDWRDEQLFFTVNHPMPRLSFHVAQGVLTLLGLGALPVSTQHAFVAEEDEFEQPIHPQVAAHFGLPFVTAQRQYPVFGQRLTFEQYINAYVSCRLQEGENKIDDFVVYLHLLAKKMQKND